MPISIGLNRSVRSPKGASQIAEFAPVMYVLFLIVLLPLLNLTALFAGAAIQYLATNDLVAKAATQSGYSGALNTMADEAYSFQANGLAHFVKMTPEGGYTGCGDDLYVVTTNIATGTVTSSAPDMPMTAPVNTAANMYELSVKSSYTLAPLVNLSSVPVLGSVPGLGQPVALSFTANRPVEHPGGFQTGTGAVATGGGIAPFNRVVNGSTTTAVASNVTWRDPNIFQQIQAAGQTVVSVNVFIVYANNPNLTPSGETVLSGQKVWIDTQAIGVWKTDPSLALTDANGYGWGAGGSGSTFPNLPCGALDGEFVGSGQPAFAVGDTLLNYQPPSGASGMLSMMENDAAGAINYADNVGEQLVRVIVTQ